MTYTIPWSRPDIGSDEVDQVVKVMRSGWASQGVVTKEFEQKLAEYSGARHAIVVNNGSSALLCALMAHGARAGDRVLVPDYTHVATANAPKLLGCRVFLVDINPETFNVDYDALESAARKLRPKFVLVVDVAGLPNDMTLLSDLARRCKFTLVDDAAESIGAECNHQKVGSHGHTATLSFHAAKQVTTIEGGAVLTGDSKVAQRCRLVRNHGEIPGRKYVSGGVGMNLRTTDLQSALGIVQHGKLDSYISRRNEIALMYKERLSQLFKFQRVPSHVTRHAYMMFIAITQSRTIRDNLILQLESNGIETRTPWPPLHTQPQFKTVHSGFPNSSALHRKCISLPLYNTMRDSEAERVICEVQSFASRASL